MRKTCGIRNRNSSRSNQGKYIARRDLFKITAACGVLGILPKPAKAEEANDKPDFEIWERTYALEIEANLEKLRGKIEELRATNPEVAEALENTLIPAVGFTLRKSWELKKVSSTVFSMTRGLIRQAAGGVPKYTEGGSEEFGNFSAEDQVLMTQALVAWYVAWDLNQINLTDFSDWLPNEIENMARIDFVYPLSRLFRGNTDQRTSK